MYAFQNASQILCSMRMARNPTKRFALKSLLQSTCFASVRNDSTFRASYCKCETFHNETNAILRMLQRSSFDNQSIFLCRSIHTASRQLSADNSDQDSNKNNGNNWKKKLFWLLPLAITIALTLSDVWQIRSSSQNKNSVEFISWNEFVHSMLAKGEVEQVVLRPATNIVAIVLHSGAVIKGKKTKQQIYYISMNTSEFENKLREAEQLNNVKPNEGIPIVYASGTSNLVTLLIVLSFVVGAIYVARRLQFSGSIEMMMPNRAKYTLIDPLIPGSWKGVKFSDVAGAHEAKQEIMEFVDFLKKPSKYKSLGAKIPRGALLLGPPGCGKTLLAKAVATEGNVPFLAMNGSEFVEVIGGLGAARVRDLFNEAKKRAPCIVYVDEIDAIGRKRASTFVSDGSGESEQTLNQLLVEMDGLLTKEGVLMLASTNRLDVLDKALLRPGRFDRHIVMDLPTLEERREIFEHHMKTVNLEKPPSFYSRRLASLTLGFSGADIANVVNESALYSARHAKKIVNGDALEYAVERFVGGTEKRSQALSPEEKRIVAFHESGHALIGWLLKYTDALIKVTIVPRTNQALGFAQYSPKDQKLYTQEEIFEKMCMALGGRVAESLTFNRVTTGAQDDLDKVTKIAYAQVRSFGFNDKVGHVSFHEEENKNVGRRPYSKKLASTIDDEVSKLIFQAYKHTEEILQKNIGNLRILAESLLQKETLNYEDVEAILGPPPHGQKPCIEPLEFENEIKSWKEAGNEP